MLEKSDSIWIVIMLAAVIAAASGDGIPKTTPQRPPVRIALGRQEVLKFLDTERDRLKRISFTKLDVNRAAN